jgi:membrane protein YqaA with SNARE-associated domain
VSTLRDAMHWLSLQLATLLAWVEGLALTPAGPAALLVLAFAESSFFPIPPDALLIPLCLGDPSKAFWFATLCSVGSVVGGVAGYGIGYYGGRPLVRRLFSEQRVAAVETYYDRYNAWAIGIAGLTPLPYKLFTLSGGAFAINFRVFLLASIVSRSLRFFLVAGLIYLFGEPIRDFIVRYLNWLTVAFVALLLLGVWLAGRGFRRSANGGEEVAVAADGGGEGEAP